MALCVNRQLSLDHAVSLDRTAAQPAPRGRRPHGKKTSAMIITAVEDLHANADYRDFSFCKISTDDPSIVGW